MEYKCWHWITQAHCNFQCKHLATHLHGKMLFTYIIANQFLKCLFSNIYAIFNSASAHHSNDKPKQVLCYFIQHQPMGRMF